MRTPNRIAFCYRFSTETFSRQPESNPVPSVIDSPRSIAAPVRWLNVLAGSGCRLKARSHRARSSESSDRGDSPMAAQIPAYAVMSNFPRERFVRCSPINGERLTSVLLRPRSDTIDSCLAGTLNVPSSEKWAIRRLGRDGGDCESALSGRKTEPSRRSLSSLTCGRKATRRIFVTRTS